MDAVRVILGPDGDATTKAVSPNFYGELDEEFSGFAGCALISHHEFEDAWPNWEMHPAGDEIVYLIEGDIDFVLWRDNTEDIVRLDEPNTYLLVPRGVWHTARPNKRTSMLFITPGAGTQHTETPTHV